MNYAQFLSVPAYQNHIVTNLKFTPDTPNPRIIISPTFVNHLLFLYLISCFFSYLAISAAIATEADFMFIPEEPVSVNWKDEICVKLHQVRSRVLRYPINF